MSQETHENVKAYYGTVLKTNSDLKTSACCPAVAPPANVQALLENVHPTVQEKFYGCGSPVPEDVQDRTILDLGCGSGRDVYILSQIVGAQGRVIGIDMTDEQLSVATNFVDWHMEKFGYQAPNVVFKKAYMEDLKKANIEDDTIDIVISNCVINLSPDKEKVFEEIFRVLRPGGELYFSDVFADQDIPAALQNDPVLLGECLGGAMTTDKFETLTHKLGFKQIAYTDKRSLTLDDADIKAKIGHIDFHSMTVQAFKGDPVDRALPAAQKESCCG